MNKVKKLELKFKCQSLPCYSSQVILFTKDQRSQEWELTPYKTEVINNSLNPEFVKDIVVDYNYEELQQFRYKFRRLNYIYLFIMIFRSIHFDY